MDYSAIHDINKNLRKGVPLASFDDTRDPLHPNTHQFTPLTAVRALRSAAFTSNDIRHGDGRSNAEIVEDMKHPGTWDWSNDTFTTSQIMKGPPHFHSGNFIQGSDQLKHLAEAGYKMLQNLHPRSSEARLLGPVLGLWESANSLKQLERFNDTRQPRLSARPLPDGRNVRVVAGDEEVVLEWMFRRLLVKILHFPGIHAANSQRAAAIDQDLYFVARAVRQNHQVNLSKAQTLIGVIYSY
jgi:hypothetical protein